VARYEFRAVIDGVDIEEEVVAKLNEAVQKAVLSELSRLDTWGDFAARIKDGSTRGIWLVALSREQAETVGLAKAQTSAPQ